MEGATRPLRTGLTSLTVSSGRGSLSWGLATSDMPSTQPALTARYPRPDGAERRGEARRERATGMQLHLFVRFARRGARCALDGAVCLHGMQDTRDIGRRLALSRCP